MRCSLGAVSSGNNLDLITQVGKRKPFLLCAHLHIVKRIDRISVRVVGVNGNNGISLFFKGFVQFYYAVFIGYGIGTMIGGEDDNISYMIKQSNL